MKCSKCNNMISNEYFEVIVVRYIGKTGRRISEKRYCPSCFDMFGALPNDSKKSVADTSKDSETSKDSDISTIKRDDKNFSETTSDI